jgi:spore photoproduct lyase
MILYIETQAFSYPTTQHIIAQFPQAEIVQIRHYKNIFDKNTDTKSLEKAIIIAKLTGNAIYPTPDAYGLGTQNFFFKTSLNCIFDCEYCFLKGAFASSFPVIFVNYDDIKQHIIAKNKNTLLPPWQGRAGEGLWQTRIHRFSSDYSDILALNHWTGFVETFVPFFETQSQNLMEIRTKSANIAPLLRLGFVPQHTEIAFSLNPQELIDRYEHGTASLAKRIEAINTLVQLWRKVGIRCMPLLPVANYMSVYEQFIQELTTSVNICQIHSFFVGGLLFQEEDRVAMRKKMPESQLLLQLEKDAKGRYAEPISMRKKLYALFTTYVPSAFVCMDEEL